MRHSIPKSNPQRRSLLAIFLLSFIGLVLFATNAFADATGQSPHAASQSNFLLGTTQIKNKSITETTVADFNPGSFYLTGMTKSTVAGGDGDGEVRLQTVGISSKDWKSVPNGFPAGLFGHTAAQRNGVIFVSGGKSNPNDLTPQSAVYTATIQSNHSLGTWLTSAVSLPVPLWGHGMTTISNTLIVIGGRTASTISNAVYTATIRADGTISPFQTAAALPSGRADFGLTQVNGTIYVIGGNDPSFSATNYVFYTKPDPISGAISSWLTATLNTPTNLAKLAATSYNDKFYVIGGTDEATFFPYTYFSQPAGNGDVASPNFTQTLVIGQNLVFASSATFGGQAFAVGGAVDNNSAGTSIIYSALISSTGEFFSPITTTLSWLQSPVLSSPRIRSASIMSDDGWLYVLGGLTGEIGSQSSLNSYDYGPTTGENPSEYAPYGKYTSPIIDVGGVYSITNIAWNTTITTSNNMSLMLQYYCGNSPTLLTLCSAPASGATAGILQTNNITVSQPARYWRYVVNYIRGTVLDQSPILNWVRVDYILPPDLTVNGIDAPAIGTTTITQSVAVYIKNADDAGTLNSPILRGNTLPTTRSGPRMINSPYPSKFFVDLYIDSGPPANVTTLGNCYGYGPAAIAAGEVVQVFIDHSSSGSSGGCPIPPNKHTFYVQVDTCDSPTECSSSYGYVAELNETNNIGGPYVSGYKLDLPLIFK